MKKKYLHLFLLCVVTIFAFSVNGNQAQAAKKKTYTVSPNSIPKEVKRSSIYNKTTKNWLQLQYYLKKLQKGGGKLVLKKGTYKINNTLYVPSNTTIELKSGAKLVKTYKKAKGITPAKNMFVLVSYNKKDKKNASAKYNGPKNIKFIGHGKKSVIDLAYIDGAHGISSSHNQNVTFQNLTFKGENGGHYIEVAGSKNVTIKGNTFMESNNSTKAKYYNKEAINIDTADENTGGFKLTWSKKDQTPNVNVVIKENVFDGMNRAIGTHKYSQKKDKNGKYSELSPNVYHENIQIIDNVFKNIYDNAVYMVNWKNTTFKNNQFIDIGVNNNRSTNTARHAITGGGILKISITGNTFTRVINGCAVYFKDMTNNGSGSQYYPVKVYVTDAELKKMLNNRVVDCIRGKFGDYDIYARDKVDGEKNGVDLINKILLPEDYVEENPIYNEDYD